MRGGDWGIQEVRFMKPWGWLAFMESFWVLVYSRMVCCPASDKVTPRFFEEVAEVAEARSKWVAELIEIGPSLLALKS